MGEAAVERAEYYGRAAEPVAEIQSMATVVHRLPAQTKTQPSASLSTARVVAWLLVAVVAVVLVWLAVPRLGVDTPAPAGSNGFADGRFPVRGIERAPALKSGNRLVRVRCGGAAAKTSYCWVSRGQPSRHS
jgi:hypothetical protein